MSPPLPEPIESELVRLLDGREDDFWPGVARLCQQHPARSKAIRREAERLQAAAEGQRPAGTAEAKPPPRDEDAELKQGDRIGAFTVLDEIGHGGMGSIFLAEQKEPVRRRVALKVIKLGMDTKAVLARFEAERQALAMMDHSHIAKVLEAGITPKGRPYFAMEYVKGVPITRYCDENKLSLEDRLALFKQVCSGVQHAHTKGVIHRDLTPNNVLVTLQDGKPAAKIIDFGLARATDQKLTEKTLFTEQGVILGTPEYMSPEQAGLSALDIDMRSDVYTLGVLLFELLTGKLPFEGRELRAQGYDAMCKTIREVEPPRPSTRVTTHQGGTDGAAKLRRTDASTLLKRLRGDLDWIVLKCLEKDRTRRYETVTHLADDVERYLTGDVVLAHAPSTAYRLAKFARRHRGELVGVAGVFALLIVGLRFSAILSREARKQASEATRQAELLRAKVAEFDQLAGVVHLDRLQEALDHLATPWQDLAAARSWLADADRVLALRPQLEQTVAGLGSLSEPRSEAQVFLHDALRGLLAKLAAFEATERADLLLRVRCAELTTSHPKARATWQQAAESIAGTDGSLASTPYQGHSIRLQPQLGLVPIGLNPVTRLWEFYELLSAWDPTTVPDPAALEIPAHDADGRIVVGDDTGIVLVLLPGGTFTMGAQSENRDGPNYDPDADPVADGEVDGTPTHRVTLSPFFLARHELTQGQWHRLGGKRPQRQLRSGNTFPILLDWFGGDSLLRAAGLTLPSEAQWEYGCRGATSSPWWTGSEKQSLADELGTLRAVGSSRSNPFGLFDVHGNVAEWCADRYGAYSAPCRPGDALRLVTEGSEGFDARVFRGGQADADPGDARSAFRNGSVPDYRDGRLGVRAARALSRH